MPNVAFKKCLEAWKIHHMRRHIGASLDYRVTTSELKKAYMQHFPPCLLHLPHNIYVLQVFVVVIYESYKQPLIQTIHSGIHSVKLLSSS